MKLASFSTTGLFLILLAIAQAGPAQAFTGDLLHPIRIWFVRTYLFYVSPVCIVLLTIAFTAARCTSLKWINAWGCVQMLNVLAAVSGLCLGFSTLGDESLDLWFVPAIIDERYTLPLTAGLDLLLICWAYWIHWRACRIQISNAAE